MVIEPLQEQRLLKEMEQEISTLYSLGVEDYEIRYLISLKSSLKQKID